MKLRIAMTVLKAILLLLSLVSASFWLSEVGMSILYHWRVGDPLSLRANYFFGFQSYT